MTHVALIIPLLIEIRRILSRREREAEAAVAPMAPTFVLTRDVNGIAETAHHVCSAASSIRNEAA